MRIGVNALYLIPGQVGGTEIYLRNVLASLAKLDQSNQYFVITNTETGADLVPPQPNFTQLKHPVVATHRPARIVWEQVVLPFTVMRHRLDVLFNPGFTAPLAASCPQLTTIHDLQYKRHPEFFKPIDLFFWKLLVGASIRRSDHLLADSISAASDIAHYFQRQAITAPLGVEDHFFELANEREQLPTQPYLLCVSTLHPHKNIELLVQAFSQFKLSHPEMHLVLAGMPGFHGDKIKSLIAKVGLESSIRLTGWIPREQVYDLYRNAHAFIFPSMFEGFGIPLVEALAAGIPSVCANIEPMISNAGGATLTFDPASVNDLANCLVTITDDEPLRDRLRQAGRRQAAQFRWENTATIILDALQAIKR